MLDVFWKQFIMIITSRAGTTMVMSVKEDYNVLIYDKNCFLMSEVLHISKPDALVKV